MKKVGKYWDKGENDSVICNLCPHKCTITRNTWGICLARKNEHGQLLSLSYGKLSAINMDPIEKKPLYHYYPGTDVLSIGSVGCNLKCSFCQNCDISQKGVAEHPTLKEYDSEELIDISLNKKNNIGIAYTYNEPLINFEYVFETSVKAKEANLKNIVVSNGFIMQNPLKQLLEYTDAFNIDLKAFNNEFYKKQTKSTLAPVLECIKTIKKQGKHIELTNLIIPGLNDSTEEFTEMIHWIVNETGRDTPLHISKYFPRYKMNIESTSELKVIELYEIAKKELTYVYGGNIRSQKYQNTHCPGCNNTAIKRNGYYTDKSGLNEHGECIKCSEKIIEYL